MKFYQVHYHDEGGSSAGYEYFTSKTQANRAAKTYDREHPDESESEIEIIEVTPTKAGIQKALNRYAGHANNG